MGVLSNLLADSKGGDWWLVGSWGSTWKNYNKLTAIWVFFF